MNERREAIAGRVCIALVIIGVILRVAFLMREDIWDDEVWSVQACAQSWDAMFASLMNDNHPDAYHAAAKAFSGLFGHVDGFTMRLHSLVWGLVSIAAAGGAAFRLLGRRIQALLAMAIVSISPQQIYYSQEARMYAMGGALMLLAGWAGLEIAERAERGERIGLVAMLGGSFAAAVAANTHFVNLFVLACLAAMLLWFGPRKSKPYLRAFAIFWILAALVCIPMVVDALSRSDQIRKASWWIPTPEPEDLLRSLGRTWMVHQDLADLQVNRGVRWLFVFDLLPLVFIGWLLAKFSALSSGSVRRVACVVLGTFAAAQLLQYCITSMGMPAFYWTRYASLVFPLASLGIAALAAEALRMAPTPGRWLVGGAAMMLGTAIAGCIVKIYPDYSAARRYLREHPEITVLYVAQHEKWPAIVENLRDPRIRSEMWLAGDIRDGRAPETIFLLVEEPWFQRYEVSWGGRFDKLLQERDTYARLHERAFSLYELKPQGWLPATDEEPWF